MELILRVRSSDGDVADVVVDVETTHEIRDLVHSLAGQLGIGDRSPIVTLTRTGRALDPDATFGESGIVSGDELTIGRGQHVAHVPPVPERAVSADVLAGPDAGESTTLLAGHYVVGRSTRCDLVVDDPTVSRVNLDVEVADDWQVTVVPRPGLANPVTVNDVEIDEPRIVGDHDVVALGGTRLAFRRFVRADTERRDQLGQIEFQRTPYRPPMVSDRTAPDVGRIPERREARRFQILSALAPLASGLAFFAFSRQPQFLVLTAMTPIVMIANFFEDRRTGRRKFEEESEAFEERVVEWRGELDDLLEAERVERLRAAPDLADLARRAELRTVDLWARGPAAPDFLRLRVGLGVATSLLDVSVGANGAEELRERARRATVGTDRISDVPVTNDLKNHGVFGIHGPDAPVSGVASSMIIQASCLHSPEDLVIAAAVDPSRPTSEWLKWLPHLRSVSSPLAGDHLATSPEECAGLVDRLLEVAEFRTAKQPGENVDRRWPWILAVIDAALEPDPADVAKLLDRCPHAGISVLWLADTAAEVPRQAVEVLVTDVGPAASLVGRIWSTDPEIADRHVEVEQIRPATSDRVARALAPIRDASTASLANSIPRVAPLLDVLEVGHPTADWVRDKWRNDHGYGLAFPIGMGANGPLQIDLVADGPHTLIGGTSGAGKSELMQSIVASLAVNHPPSRLNFLFVDYKGGASSNVFGALPHTVGYVTNLSAELSMRALTSLRAELNRRMQVMEGRAKDLEEMLELHPDDAPASLVIIVDEFATLVKEVPEFVAGVVDIAQRGRSLGIHLILATQRPSGSVNENILANTNLRMSLRMLDHSESMSVIGSPEAGDIPVPLKGRAYARLGPRHLAAFQSAFCGAPLTTEEIESPILVADFERPTDSPKSVGPSDPAAGATGTHLDAVLAAVGGAAGDLALPAPRRPWRDVLADVVDLTSVLEDPRSAPARELPGRLVAVGMIDVPEQQDQRPAIVDLEEGGGWMIFGSGGSGKTTVLRTVAVSVAALSTPEQVEMFGFDFASRGLASIAPLPHVVDVVSGDDLEAVTRHLATLADELQRRRRLLAGAHAEHLTAYNERSDPLSRILVLLDGFGGFVAQFVGASSPGQSSLAVPLDRWAEVLGELVVEGRQVGIHVVMTADRRAAIPSRLHSSVSNRLIMRHADASGYGEHSVPMERAKTLDLSPGRALWQADAIVQIASVSADPLGKAQVETIRRFAEALPEAPPSRLASRPLPDVLPPGPLPSTDGGENPKVFTIGITDRTHAPAVVDLSWSHLLIAGGGRSGRSTALSACAAGLADTHSLWGMGPSSSMIDRSLLDEEAFGRADVLSPLLERLKNVFELGPPKKPVIVLIDDLDTFDDMSLNAGWEALVGLDDVRVIASMDTRSIAGYTTNPLMQELRRARRMLLLQPDDPTEVLQSTGIRAPIRPGQRMVPGRGVLIADRVPSVVQVVRADAPV